MWNIERQRSCAVLKIIGCCLVLLICTTNALALSDKDKLLLMKNFPFLYLLEKPLQELNKPPHSFIENRLRLERDAVESIKNCKTASCFSNTLQFAEDEIMLLGNELVQLVLTEKTIKKNVGI